MDKFESSLVENIL